MLFFYMGYNVPTLACDLHGTAGGGGGFRGISLFLKPFIL